MFGAAKKIMICIAIPLLLPAAQIFTGKAYARHPNIAAYKRFASPLFADPKA